MSENTAIVNIEKSINKLWNDNNIFQKTLQASINKNPKYHRDGPPFLNVKASDDNKNDNKSTIHYGHLVVGSLKDIFCRYLTMRGNYVHRSFGGDTHGLPMEQVGEKILGIKYRSEIEKIGIKKFNDTCRDVVYSCLDSWKPIMESFGRWVSFDDRYLTCDTNFMESVIWAFKELYNKGLVYRGFKVMPYSTACATAISNFEASQNYKLVRETFVYVCFPLINPPEYLKDTSLLVWTTTPWTLPANIAVCVNGDSDYCVILDRKSNKKLIVSVEQYAKIFTLNKGDNFNDLYDIVSNTFKGKELYGLSYEPLFNYYSNIKNDNPKVFTIICDNFVITNGNDAVGTGLVHIAPAFGEDDYRVSLNENIIDKRGKNLLCPIDDNGNYLDIVDQFKGQYIKDVEKELIIHLKKNNRIYKTESKEHSYPFCWRSDTPLIYKAVDAWCIEVTKIKDRIIELNKDINWHPDWAKTGRFLNWLANTKDWVVSRSRFWGTPIPIWTSDDGEEIVCIGSIDELEELSGVRVCDLHRENIDNITIPSKLGKGQLKRVSDVLDCWFESGSVPFAMHHYPFENKEYVEQSITMDFVAEGLDQTRGWFYTLNVLSTALFDKPAFKNVIASGLVLAKDGQKMSKRLGNFTDPYVILNKYGADALRLYFLSSPIMKGENLNFSEDGLLQCVKNVQLLWLNAYKFFNEYYTKFTKNNNNQLNKSDHLLDNWIILQFNNLRNIFINDMDKYDLSNIYHKLQKFIDTLTNKYIKLSRDDLKGKNGLKRWSESLYTLYIVLFELCKLMAPFTPFISEYMYQELRKLNDKSNISVHLDDYANELYYNPNNLNKIDDLIKTIDMVRTLRGSMNVSMKYPVKNVIICGSDELRTNIDGLKDYLINETNLLNLEFNECNKYMKFVVQPNSKEIGKKFKNNAQYIKSIIEKFTDIDIKNLLSNQTYNTQYGVLTINDVCIKYDVYDIDKKYKYITDQTNDTILVMMDTTQDDEIIELYNARYIATQIQNMRKEAGLHPWDKIETYYNTESNNTIQLIDKKMDYIKNITNYDLIIKTPNEYLINRTIELTNGDKLTVYIVKL